MQVWINLQNKFKSGTHWRYMVLFSDPYGMNVSFLGSLKWIRNSIIGFRWCLIKPRKISEKSQICMDDSINENVIEYNYNTKERKGIDRKFDVNESPLDSLRITRNNFIPINLRCNNNMLITEPLSRTKFENTGTCRFLWRGALLCSEFFLVHFYPQTGESP